MEDRIASDRAGRPGAALAALVAILGITAAWWALALWPAGADQPEWLARTRAACFGAMRGGLPDAGGWILLVGEPLGMLGMLVAGWGSALRRDLRWIGARRGARIAAATAAALVLVMTTALAVRVVRLLAATRSVPINAGGAPRRVDLSVPGFALVDQHGQRTTLTDFRPQTTILTFAYGHCSTVCPSIVNDVRAARRAANRPDIPLVIVTLDPWRDTPDRLPMLAEHWGLEPGDRVLSGTIEAVGRTLDLLQIGRGRNMTTGDIDHVTVAMILDERGRVSWRLDGRPSSLARLIRSPLP